MATGREVGMATAKDGAGMQVGMATTAGMQVGMATTAGMQDGMATTVGMQVGTAKVGAAAPN
jgi:hypothetical protein